MVLVVFFRTAFWDQHMCPLLCSQIFSPLEVCVITIRYTIVSEDCFIFWFEGRLKRKELSDTWYSHSDSHFRQDNCQEPLHWVWRDNKDNIKSQHAFLSSKNYHLKLWNRLMLMSHQALAYLQEMEENSFVYPSHQPSLATSAVTHVNNLSDYIKNIFERLFFPQILWISIKICSSCLMFKQKARFKENIHNLCR